MVLPGGIARAGGFGDESLSLRLPAALSRFAPYGDVAAVGGASAASTWSSGINPASTAWRPISSDLRLSLSPQYSAISFDRGTNLNVTAEALSWDAGSLGVFQPALAQAWSNREETRQGLDFRLNMNVAQVQWAKKCSEDWAFGGNFNFAKSKTRFDLGSVDVSESASESYDFRVGALHRLLPKLLGGVVFGYGFSPSRTTVFDFLGLGTGNIRTYDTGQQFILRPGLSYEYVKDSFIYADYQYGNFSDDTGHLEVNRFYGGVEHQIVKGLYVRGGVALDARGNPSWTAGVGIYPTDRFSIDIGYQDNMFPELTPDFGRSRTLAISIGITF